ncbi:MAG: hypothetical protein V4608_10855 [Bacteroidota bacterium]
MKIHFQALEWIIQEMKLKTHEIREKNPDFNFYDAEKKIAALKQAQNYVYDSYDQMKAGSKREFALECANLKLCKDLEEMNKL